MVHLPGSYVFFLFLDHSDGSFSPPRRVGSPLLGRGLGTIEFGLELTFRQLNLSWIKPFLGRC